MDPAVQVAAVTTAGVVVAAWLARPTLPHYKRLKRIEGEFHNNGGSTAKDQLDRIETGLSGVRDDVMHLRGRFDQHVTDTTLARHEGIRMWQAVEAVAQAAPPEGDTNG